MRAVGSAISAGEGDGYSAARMTTHASIGANHQMVDKNDPLLRELGEEMRREQLQKLWEQYGTYLLAGAALIVALVGGFKAWESHQKSAAEASGAAYEAAAELANTGKVDAATRAFDDIAKDGPAGYATLAELTLAGSNLKAGRPGDALVIYEKLANGGTNDSLLASYAALQAAALRIGEADFAEMQDRLTPLAADGAPWRYNARELLGMAALKAGKLSEARSAFSPLLVDPNVPDSMRERVQRAMADLASTEVATKAPPAEATPAPDGGEKPATTPDAAPK